MAKLLSGNLTKELSAWSKPAKSNAGLHRTQSCNPPGFDEFVAECRKKGFRLVIVSNGLDSISNKYSQTGG